MWPSMNVFAHVLFVFVAARYGTALPLVLWFAQLTILDLAAALYCVAVEEESIMLVPYAVSRARCSVWRAPAPRDKKCPSRANTQSPRQRAWWRSILEHSRCRGSRGAVAGVPGALSATPCNPGSRGASPTTPPKGAPGSSGSAASRATRRRLRRGAHPGVVSDEAAGSGRPVSLACFCMMSDSSRTRYGFLK